MNNGLNRKYMQLYKNLHPRFKTEKESTWLHSYNTIKHIKGLFV